MDTIQKNKSSIGARDFLLNNDYAKTLYHEYAKDLPIIDYHCHIPPAEIASDKQFKNLTEIWLAGDHYKWRAMRTMGVDEDFITGNASSEDKFRKWAETVPYTLRNPLYHWTHLELKRYFDIDEFLTPETADKIYRECNEKLQTKEFSTRSLIRKMNVSVICTTDDPADSLNHHQKIKEDGFDVKVLPGFRPDAAYNFADPASYNDYLDRLGEAANTEISSYDNLIQALFNRMDFFHENGCRLSDHGLKKLYYRPSSQQNVNSYFEKIRSGSPLTGEEQEVLTYSILTELGRQYSKKGWVQQFHLGALRNTNRRMMKQLGPDTGFDSVGDYPQAENMASFFNELDTNDQLAKTIIYNLNPSDNTVFATMAGNFNDGSVRGKMQYGSAWWFLDQKDGIEDQLNVLSNMGLLSCFIGMLTDSRSFLSYPRHEYFRRVLCNLIGTDIANDELPADLEWTGKIVSDICYRNADTYFNF